MEAKDGMYFAMLADKRLTNGDKLVWHGYAAFIGIGEWGFVMQKSVARMLAITTPYCSNATLNLIDAGYLERSESENKHYRIPKAMAHAYTWRQE